MWQKRENGWKEMNTVEEISVETYMTETQS